MLGICSLEQAVSAATTIVDFYCRAWKTWPVAGNQTGNSSGDEIP